MVVGRRVQEGGEDSVRRVFCGRYCIEASSCGRIDLEDSIALLVERGRDVRQRYAGARRWVLAESRPYVFECLAK